MTVPGSPYSLSYRLAPSLLRMGNSFWSTCASTTWSLSLATAPTRRWNCQQRGRMGWAGISWQRKNTSGLNTRVGWAARNPTRKLARSAFLSPSPRKRFLSTLTRTTRRRRRRRTVRRLERNSSVQTVGRNSHTRQRMGTQARRNWKSTSSGTRWRLGTVSALTCQGSPHDWARCWYFMIYDVSHSNKFLWILVNCPPLFFSFFWIICICMLLFWKILFSGETAQHWLEVQGEAHQGWARRLVALWQLSGQVCIRLTLRDFWSWSSFSCESKETLEEHMTKHTKKYMCDSCGFKADDSNKLYYHRQVTHEAVMVPCPDCGKMFKDRYLKLHQRKVHSAAACEICGVVVKNVKHHMQGVHMADSDKRFHCKDCGKGFMCRVTMDNHRMNMHIKAQPYQCRYGCDNRYNDTSNRSAHERRRHGAVWTAEHAKLQKFVWLEIRVYNTLLKPIDICLNFPFPLNFMDFWNTHIYPGSYKCNTSVQCKCTALGRIQDTNSLSFAHLLLRKWLCIIFTQNLILCFHSFMLWNFFLFHHTFSFFHILMMRPQLRIICPLDETNKSISQQIQARTNFSSFFASSPWWRKQHLP